MLPEDEIFINHHHHFYPCMKYKIPANPKLDGTDYFIVAESMQWQPSSSHDTRYMFDCHLSFTCENDQKAFYKIIKDCLLSHSIRILLKSCKNTKNGSLHL